MTNSRSPLAAFAGITVGLTALALAALLGAVQDTAEPAVHLEPVQLAEDDPGWDYRTMGNRSNAPVVINWDNCDPDTTCEGLEADSK